MELIILFWVVTSTLQYSQIFGAVICGPVGIKLCTVKHINDPVETINRIPRTSYVPPMLYWNYNTTNGKTTRAWKTQEAIRTPRRIDWMGNACDLPTEHNWQTNGYCEPTIQNWKREVLYQTPVQPITNAWYNQPTVKNWNNNAYYNDHVPQAWNSYVPNQPVAGDWTYVYNQPVAEYWKAVYNQPIVQNWNGGVSNQPYTYNGQKAGELNHSLVEPGNWNSQGSNKLILYENSDKPLGKLEEVNDKQKQIEQHNDNHDLGASLEANATERPLIHAWMAKNNSRSFVKSKTVNDEQKIMLDKDWRTVDSNQRFVIDNAVAESKQTSVKTVNLNNKNQTVIGLNDWKAVHYKPNVGNKTDDYLNQTSVKTDNVNSTNQPPVDLNDLNKSNQPLIIDKKVDLSDELAVQDLMENGTSQPMKRDWKASHYSQLKVKDTRSDSAGGKGKGNSANLPDLASSDERRSNYVLTDKPTIHQLSSSQEYNLKKTLEPVLSDIFSNTSIGNRSTTFAAHTAAMVNNLSSSYANDSADTIIAAPSDTSKTVTLPESNQHLVVGNSSETMALADIVEPLIPGNTSKDTTFPDTADTSSTTKISGVTLTDVPKNLTMRNISTAAAFDNADKIAATSNIVDTVMSETAKNISTHSMLEAKTNTDSARPSITSINSKNVTFQNTTQTPDANTLLEFVMPANASINRTSGTVLHPPNIIHAVSKSPSTITRKNAVKVAVATKTHEAGTIFGDLTLADANESAPINISKAVMLAKVAESPATTNTSQAITLPGDGKTYDPKLSNDANTSASSSISKDLYVAEVTTEASSISEVVPLDQVVYNITEPVTLRYPSKAHVALAKADGIPTYGNTSLNVSFSDADALSATTYILKNMTFPDNAEASASINTMEIVAVPNATKIPATSNTLKIKAAPENTESSASRNTSKVVTVSDNTNITIANNTLGSVTFHDYAEVLASRNNSEVVINTSNTEILSAQNASEAVSFHDSTEVPSSTFEIVALRDNTEILTASNTSKTIAVPDASKILADNSTLDIVKIHANFAIPTVSNPSEVVIKPDNADIASSTNTSDVLAVHYNAELPYVNNTWKVVNAPNATEMTAASNISEVVIKPSYTEISASMNLSEATAYNNATEIPAASSTLKILTYTDNDKAPASNNTLEVATSTGITEQTAFSKTPKRVATPDEAEMLAPSSTLEVTSHSDTAEIPVAKNSSEFVNILYEASATNNTSELLFFPKSSGIRVASKPLEAMTFRDINETTFRNNTLEKSLMLDNIQETKNNNYIAEATVNTNKTGANNTLETPSIPDTAQTSATSNTSKVVPFPDSSAMRGFINTSDVRVSSDPAKSTAANRSAKAHILPNGHDSAVASNILDLMMLGIITETLALADVDKTHSASHISTVTTLPNTPKKSFEDILIIPALNNSRSTNKTQIVDLASSLAQEDLPSSQFPKTHSHKEEQTIRGNSTNPLLEHGANEADSIKSEHASTSLNESPASSSDTPNHDLTPSTTNTAESLDVATTPRYSKTTASLNDTVDANVTFGARTDDRIFNANNLSIPPSFPPQQLGDFTQLFPKTADAPDQWNHRNQSPSLDQYSSQLYPPTTSGTYLSHVCPLCWSRWYSWHAPQ